MSFAKVYRGFSLEEMWYDVSGHKLEPKPGSRVDLVATELAVLVAHIGEPVEVQFNGTPMVANVGDSPQAVCSRWDTTREGIQRRKIRNATWLRNYPWERLDYRTVADIVAVILRNDHGLRGPEGGGE